MIFVFGRVASLVALAILWPAVGLLGAEVTGFGAKGDGITNDTEAFKKAFASGQQDIYVPPGTYLIGPESMTLAKATYLHGAGRASVLKVAEDTEQLLLLDANVRLERLHFDGAGAKSGDISDPLIALGAAGWPQDPPDNITIDSLSFLNCDRTCLRTDHNNYVVISNCDFRKVGAAICLDFSRHVKVINNTIVDARVHGIQFWGNSNWTRRESENLIFANNYVKNGGSGPIWGTGATRVVMIGNIVDGANDIGLDLEWCGDSVITGNTVRNAHEAGIALFYACDNVSISGNTVINDMEITEPEAERSWWVRSGIWLTYPNRDVFKNDRGHRNITITGNTLHCADGPRRAIWIGSESHDVVVSNNTGHRAGFWFGGAHKQPMSLVRFDDGSWIRDGKIFEKQ